MRKFFILLLCLPVMNMAYAQSETSEQPASTTTVKEEKTDDFIELKKNLNKSKDRLVIDFTYDMLLNAPDSIGIKGFSRGFNIYFTYDIVLGKSRFSVAPGIGIGTNNYFHNSTISSDSVATHFTPIPDDISVKKTKIGLTYLDIPLELRFRSVPNKKGTSWKLAAGIKAGMLLQSKWKYKGEDLAGSGEDVKFKQYDIDFTNRFRYGVLVRGGYGIINAFVYYSLSDIFQDGRAPRMTPLSVGISINGL